MRRFRRMVHAQICTNTNRADIALLLLLGLAAMGGALAN